VGSRHGRFVRACVDGFYWENCCGAREEVFQFDPRNLGPYRLEPFAGGHCYPQRLSWQQVEGDVVEALEIPHCDTPFEFLVLVAKLNARTLAEHHPPAQGCEWSCLLAMKQADRSKQGGCSVKIVAKIIERQGIDEREASCRNGTTVVLVGG
jgi:hypothetical protein